MIRYSFRSLCFVILMGSALAVGHAPAAAGPAGTPTVIDGDTIELDGQTIRLHGIDAPELGQTCLIKTRPYDCGNIARTALLDLTAGATVRCEPVARDGADTAGEGRPGRCFAAGYYLSEGMIYTGWALADRAVSKRYVVHEEGARDARRGLWKGRFVTPWDWRQGARLPAETRTE